MSLRTPQAAVDPPVVEVRVSHCVAVEVSSLSLSGEFEDKRLAAKIVASHNHEI